MSFPFALLPPPAAVASIGISGSPSGRRQPHLDPAPRFRRPSPPRRRRRRRCHVPAGTYTLPPRRRGRALASGSVYLCSDFFLKTIPVFSFSARFVATDHPWPNSNRSA